MKEWTTFTEIPLMRTSVCNGNFFFSPPTKIKTQLLLPFIWLSFLPASRGVRTLKLAEAVRGYWTAWVTAHCQPATWFLFPRGSEMKLFLRSVGCLIDTADGICTRLMYSLSFIMSTRAGLYLLFLLYLYLMFCWKEYLIIPSFCPVSDLYMSNSVPVMMSDITTYSVNISCHIVLHYLQSVIHRRRRLKGFWTTAPALTTPETAWTLCTPLQTAKQRGERRHLICSLGVLYRGTWSEQQSGVSRARGQQRSENPLALYVPESSDLCLVHCVHIPLPPEAVRGGCNCTPPSTTKKSSVRYSGKIVRSSESGATRLRFLLQIDARNRAEPAFRPRDFMQMRRDSSRKWQRSIDFFLKLQSRDAFIPHHDVILFERLNVGSDETQVLNIYYWNEVQQLFSKPKPKPGSAPEVNHLFFGLFD